MSSVSIARQRGLYSNITDQELPQIRSDISQLREQISSGKRINRPSDGPSDYSVAEEMGRLDSKIDRRLSTITDSQSFVDRTLQEIEGIGNLFAEAKEKGVQAANDSLSDDDRRAVAQELRSIKSETVDRLNARHNGEYLFGGNRTQVKPFDEEGGVNGTSVNGTPEKISGERKRSIGQGQKITTNIPGSELHQYGSDGAGRPETITEALDGLISAVDPDDASATDIQARLDDVDEARDHVLGKAGKAGVISNRLSAAQDQLEARQLEVRERQSNAEDTDLAKAATDLQQRQTQLQAALKAVASTQQQASLVNFL